MKYIYAALLLHEAGKEITEENLKKVLEVVGTDIDEGKIKSLAAALKNIDIEEIIKSAMAAPALPAAPAAPTVEAKPEEKKVEKVEEKKEEEEEKEEEALEGLGALFG